MGVVSSSEATICRVDEQQGDGRKEDLGPSWCHLNGSIKKQRLHESLVPINLENLDQPVFFN